MITVKGFTAAAVVVVVVVVAMILLNFEFKRMFTLNLAKLIELNGDNWQLRKNVR